MPISALSDKIYAARIFEIDPSSVLYPLRISRSCSSEKNATSHSGTFCRRHFFRIDPSAILQPHLLLDLPHWREKCRKRTEEERRHCPENRPPTTVAESFSGKVNWILCLQKKWT